MKFKTEMETRAFKYRMRPYLRHVPYEVLRQRLNDIIRNVYGFQKDGRIGRCIDDDMAKLFYGLLGDAVTAYSERDMDQDEFGESIDFSRTPWSVANYEKIAKNLCFADLLDGPPAFYKFGDNVEHMERLLKDGDAWVSPATSFKDSKLDYARQDSEMVLPQYICPYDFELRFIHPKLRKNLPVRNQIELSIFKPTNHFLYCVTTRFDFRYLVDFSNTVAFVVIKDQNEFIRRLIAAAQKEWADFKIKFSNARYVDPFQCLYPASEHGEDIFFVKNIAYLYQFEHRLVVYPDRNNYTAGSDWRPRTLKIGSLEDIAEMRLIEL